MQEKAERDLTEYDKREQANREQYVMLRSVHSHIHLHTIFGI